MTERNVISAGIALAVMAMFLNIATADQGLSGKEEVPPERVVFQKGSTSATVKGRIQGYEVKNYVVRSKADQTMAVNLKSANIYTYFAVLSPDGQFMTKIEETNWSTVLPIKGDYVIRVFMLRVGARKKGSVADYIFNVSIK